MEKEKKIYDETCTCGCQEGKSCTCNKGKCTCGCEDGNCTCDETCTCGCQSNKTCNCNKEKKS